MVSAESALDVFSHSRSYRLFFHTINRTRKLLKWSSSGLLQAQELPNRILQKIENAKAVIIEPKNADDPSMMTITLSDEDIEAVKFAIKGAKEILYNRMHFHLHEVILMALWSSFESYLKGIVQQFYTQNAAELASDKQVSYRDLIENQIPVNAYLVEREIGDFGHLSFVDMRKYIKGHLKYDFNDDEISVLSESYFLRNVAAHNSGFIRSSQQSLVPGTIGIRNNQIEIPLEYLEATITSIESIVKRMDTYIIGRWNVPKSDEALFDDLPKISSSDN